ncbi:MAG: hypothetical protein JNK10_11765 [Cyclobacteriaceae bacterium]|nr:hypothetical protein [Cyclobacteriaceae bacterium]
MSKHDFEIKSLVLIVLIGYSLNFVLTFFGYVFNHETSRELLFYQIANAFAISASVMAGRYVGLRGQHVAASAYILLGIAHGISLAALSRSGINADRGIMMAIPMIPSFIFIFWCTLYPMWLRLAGLIPSGLILFVFVSVQSGDSYFGAALSTAYASLQIIELTWGYFLFRNWRHSIAADRNMK